jgi:hypothetical protein
MSSLIKDFIFKLINDYIFNMFAKIISWFDLIEWQYIESYNDDKILFLVT